MDDEPEVDDATTVRVLLSAAGLTVPEDDLGRLVGLYPGLRRRIDRLYEIDTGDEVTTAVFRADDGASS